MILLAHGFRINKNLTVGTHIASGGFGDVYQARYLGKDVAIKISKLERRGSLRSEIEIFEKLRNRNGFPKMYSTGYIHGCEYIVMERLGRSLQSVRKKIGVIIDTNTIAMIGISITYQLEALHRMGYVHGDIKPENILTGIENTESEYELFLIDFGNVTTYRSRKGVKFPQREVRYDDIAGTIAFAPVSWHKKTSLSRKDDFESLAYTLRYLYEFRLPWSALPATNFSQILKIGKFKERMKRKPMFHGMHQNMHTFYRHICNLDFDECPDYHGIRRLFREILKENRVQNEKDYSWLERPIPSGNLLDTFTTEQIDQF